MQQLFPSPSNFVFAGKSIAEMAGVHWEITVAAHLLIRVSSVDFCFHDGLRSIEEQKRNVAAGVSRTLETKHLKGDAGDLVPWIDGKLTWEEKPCIELARGMQQVLKFTGTSQIWGGVWDRPLESLSDDL